MPELSRFFGIVIGMFYDERGPPHFHARYGEYKISGVDTWITMYSKLAG